MMNDPLEKSLNELLDMARSLPDGPTKVALLEEAVRRVDVQQDLKLGFALRKELIRAATLSGVKEKAIVAFAWRLAHCDRDPEQFPEADLLWEYKWIVDCIADFPHISHQQIAKVLADLERRYHRADLSNGAVHKLRCQIAQTMGHVEEAREEHRLWRSSPLGKGSDCLVCSWNGHVEYLLFAGQEELAVKEAKPLLGTLGRLVQCAEVPHLTYASVLLPLVRLGRFDEAIQCHLLGYPLVATNAEYLTAVARHLRFVTVTNNLDRAVQLFEKHLPWAVETLNPLRQFEYYQSVCFLLETLRETRHETIAARLPAALPFVHDERSYKLADLTTYFDEQCHDLAARFDTRNGNDYFTRRLEEPAQWKQLITPQPLPRG
jgi:hypothetical protein